MSAPKSPTPALDALNPQQRAFVRAFMVLRKIRDSAIEAGYKAKSAHNQGHRLMQRADVKAAIAEMEAIAQAKAEKTLDDIVAEQTRIAFTGMSKFLRIDPNGNPVFDLSVCTPEDLDLLAEVTIEEFVVGSGDEAKDVRKIKIKPLDRQKALDVLGKHLGMGNKAQDDRVDSFQQALLDIMERGSAMPVGRKS